MSGPFVKVLLPCGREVAAGPDAILGRSPGAALRIDDARVSTVHAELSWRAEGFVLLARGGRLTVGGRGARTIVLQPGLRIAVAPAIEIVVVSVGSGLTAPTPPTAGRERLRFEFVPPDVVDVTISDGPAPALQLTGLQARLLAHLLSAREGEQWDSIAEAIWPEDAALRRSSCWTVIDERRFRNRWDQNLSGVRRAIAPLGRVVQVRQGVVVLGLGPEDAVTGPCPGPRGDDLAGTAAI